MSKFLIITAVLLSLINTSVVFAQSEGPIRQRLIQRFEQRDAQDRPLPKRLHEFRKSGILKGVDKLQTDLEIINKAVQDSPKITNKTKREINAQLNERIQTLKEVRVKIEKTDDPRELRQYANAIKKELKDSRHTFKDRIQKPKQTSTKMRAFPPIKSAIGLVKQAFSMIW